MKRICVLILLFSVCLQYSCKKETIKYATTGDQITKQLQKVITDNGITRIIAWDDKGGFPTVSPTLGVGWTFSNGFITINGYGYDSRFTRNLLYLDSYDVSKVLVTDGTNPLALILHFKS
jgi:hypothetical protein